MKLKSIILASGLFLAGIAHAAPQVTGLPDFTVLVENNAPAVVNISTVQKSNSRGLRRMPQDMPENGPFGEWFKHFFGEEGEGGGMPDRDAQSLGSGFIISTDGYVLTNNHVVQDAEKIIVRLSDRRELEAELIGTDPRSDLALLKLNNGKSFPAVKIGNSKVLKPGEWVLAIGSPFGFDYSVTAGIVSGKGRSLPRESYVPFIQTDVAINPGNSGGPLFNLSGEVVGINSQIYSRTGGYMGLSFAIPIDVAMNVVEQLKNKGKVVRGWLGVLIQDVTRELAESFNMDKPQGALVSRVLENSPAEAAGFEAGDVIVKYNGHVLDHSSELPPLVGITPIDRKVPVEIIREGKRKTLKVKIGELPQQDDIKVSSNERGDSKTNKLGLVVADLDARQRERLDVAEGGILVEDVRGGAAAKAGIRRGDVILKLNYVDIKNVSHFKELVDDLPEGKSIPVLVNRRGNSIFLALKVNDE